MTIVDRTGLSWVASVAGRLIFSLTVFLGATYAVAQGAPAAVIPSTSKPLPCPVGTVALVARALHFSGAADFWEHGPDIDCQLDPSRQQLAIVALTYIHGEEQSGIRHADTDGDSRNLDLAVWDIGRKQLIAHRHEDKAIEDDAIHLEDMAIDTSAYALAEGHLVFGLRTAHATHCSCDNSSDEYLALYIQDGDRLDEILDFSLHASGRDVSSNEAAAAPSCRLMVDSSTSLTKGQGTSHGLANIVLTAMRTLQFEPDGGSAPCPTTRYEKNEVRLHFDGKGYVPPDRRVCNTTTRTLGIRYLPSTKQSFRYRLQAARSAGLPSLESSAFIARIGKMDPEIPEEAHRACQPSAPGRLQYALFETRTVMRWWDAEAADTGLNQWIGHSIENSPGVLRPSARNCYGWGHCMAATADRKLPC